MMFLGIISNAIDAIQNIIGTLLYTLLGWALILFINLFQGLFRGFAGVGSIQYGSENITYSPDNPLGEKTGGIVYYLMNSEVVRNLIISMAILGLFLLIIFTAMAFIKNVYSDKPKNWKDIVASSLKGLMNFVFIPTLCLLGVALSNILLNAIDSATNPSGTTEMAVKLVVCSAYNANRIREGNDSINDEVATALGYENARALKNYIGNDSSRREECAKKLDAWVGEHVSSTQLMWVGNVDKYYRLWDINFIILGVGGVFICYVLIKLTYGMIKRMFILLMLFVISPALCSLYPLDDGNAVKSWSKDFVKNTISAYGVIAGMNLFFSLSPLLERINFGWWDPIGLVPLILMISGLYVVNDFVTMISGYISAGNAMADGASLRGNVKSGVKKYTGVDVDKAEKGLFKALGNGIKGGVMSDIAKYTSRSAGQDNLWGRIHAKADDVERRQLNARNKAHGGKEISWEDWHAVSGEDRKKLIEKNSAAGIKKKALKDKIEENEAKALQKNFLENKQLHEGKNFKNILNKDGLLAAVTTAGYYGASKDDVFKQILKDDSFYKKDKEGKIIYKKDNKGNEILDKDGNKIPETEKYTKPELEAIYAKQVKEEREKELANQAKIFNGASAGGNNPPNPPITSGPGNNGGKTGGGRRIEVISPEAAKTIADAVRTALAGNNNGGQGTVTAGLSEPQINQLTQAISNIQPSAAVKQEDLIAAAELIRDEIHKNLNNEDIVAAVDLLREEMKRNGNQDDLLAAIELIVQQLKENSGK